MSLRTVYGRSIAQYSTTSGSYAERTVLISLLRALTLIGAVSIVKYSAELSSSIDAMSLLKLHISCQACTVLVVMVTSAAVVMTGPFPTSAAFAEAQSPHAESASGFRLVGTIVSESFAGAVLDDARGEQKFYRLFQALPDESRIVRIQSRGIVLELPDGRLLELITMTGGGSAVASSAAVPPVVPHAAERTRAVRRESPDPPRYDLGSPVSSSGAGEKEGEGRTLTRKRDQKEKKKLDPGGRRGRHLKPDEER